MSVLLVLLLGGFGGYLSAEAMSMQPPTVEEEWFPSGHMLNGLTSSLQVTMTTTIRARAAFVVPSVLELLL